MLPSLRYIYYKTRIVDGAEKIIAYSYDGKDYHQEGGSEVSTYLYEAKSRGRTILEKDLIEDSKEYKSVKEDYDRVIELYKQLKDSSLNIEEKSQLALGLADAYISRNMPKSAIRELDELSKQENLPEGISSEISYRKFTAENMNKQSAKAYEDLVLSDQQEALSKIRIDSLDRISEKMTKELDFIKRQMEAKQGAGRVIPGLVAGYTNAELQNEYDSIKTIQTEMQKGIDIAKSLVGKGEFDNYRNAQTDAERKSVLERAFSDSLIEQAKKRGITTEIGRASCRERV